MAKTSTPLRTCRYCGISAYDEQSLDLFVKRVAGRYGRDALCRKCSNKRKWNWLRGLPVETLPIPLYLRKCRVCGLEAWTKDDLESFVKEKLGRYGRENRCKKCYSKIRKKHRIRSRELFNRRQRELIEGFQKPIKCYFCGSPINKLFGGDKDPNALVIHSLDGNHENWDPKNKVPAHKGCHNSFHNKNRSPELMLNLITSRIGEKHNNWLGDNVTKASLRSRKSRAKKREKRVKELLRQIEENK